MDSYDFTTSLIESNTILDYETYTESAIKAILANDLTQEKFIDMLNDFTLQDILQRGNSGSQIHKCYTLTPEAFKKCLMRARKYKDQPIDPVIYCDYYLLLEKVFKLFTDYERAYSTKLLSMKDDKIDKLTEKMDEQNKKIDKLLNYSNAITKQNVDLIERTDHLQITADMTQEDLDKSLIYQKEILNHLVDKSYKSTMNP